jgi:hypothetical protein
MPSATEIRTNTCCRPVSLQNQNFTKNETSMQSAVNCYPKGCAAPGQVQCQCNTRGSLSKLKRAPPQTKINVTSKSPVGDISVVTLIRTDTTLDHSQKAEKVWCHWHSIYSWLSDRKQNGESKSDANCTDHKIVCTPRLGRAKTSPERHH